LLLAFELFNFLVVKAKIKELFAALKAVARVIKNQADTRAQTDLLFYCPCYIV
jgi:hypothetical protein